MPRNPAISPVRSPGTGAGRGSADARVAAPSAPAGSVTRAGAAALLSPPRSPRRNAGPQTTQVNDNVTSPGPASPGRQRGRGRATGDPLSPPPTGASTLGLTVASVTSPPSVTPRRGAGPQTTQVYGNVTSPGPASPGRQRGRGRATGDPPPPPPTGAAPQDGVDPAPPSLLDALQSALEPSDSDRANVAPGQSSVAPLPEPAAGLLPVSPAGPGERKPPMPPAQPLVLGGSVMGLSAATRLDEHGTEDGGVSAPSVGFAAGTARQALEGTFGRLSDGLLERLHALALSEQDSPQGSYASGGPPHIQTAAQALV